MTRLPDSPGGLRSVVFDIECFLDYFCCTMTDGERLVTYERQDFDRLIATVSNPRLCLIGYNSFAYDNPMLAAICDTPSITHAQLKGLSDRLINDDQLDEEARDEQFLERYRKRPWGLSIDVLQMLNRKGSLKEHACRASLRLVEETPWDFSKPLPPELIPRVRYYCEIDVKNTAETLLRPTQASQLFGASPWDMVQLRVQLDREFDIGPRIFCMSAQATAQAIFLKLHKNRTGEYTQVVREAAEANPVNRTPEFPLSDIITSTIAFRDETLRYLLSDLLAGCVGRTDVYGRKWEIRSDAQLTVPFAGTNFQVGVGGLHSIDGPGRFEADDEHRIVDLDVTSYYPSLIVGLGLYPAQIGPEFTTDLKNIFNQRVAAKREMQRVEQEIREVKVKQAGAPAATLARLEVERATWKTKADAYKLVSNSLFGKLNDYYSPLRSVPDALRVTINGQLFLLMLIEMLAERDGFRILSANTDGVTIMLPRGQDGADDLAEVVSTWQRLTGFALEEVEYTRIARRDVNDYVAITDKGKVKCKGVFENPKGDGRAITKAAVAWLTKRTPIAETFAACKPEDFVFYQRCGKTGMIYADGLLVGKLARWVMVEHGETLVRVTPKQRATLEHGVNVALTTDLSHIPEPFLPAYVEAAEALICSTLAPMPVIAPKLRKLCA